MSRKSYRTSTRGYRNMVTRRPIVFRGGSIFFRVMAFVLSFGLFAASAIAVVKTDTGDERGPAKKSTRVVSDSAPASDFMGGTIEFGEDPPTEGSYYWPEVGDTAAGWRALPESSKLAPAPVKK